MAERIRITFDVPERIRRALNIEASRTGVTLGDVVETLVENHLQKSLQLADEAISEGSQAGTNKRGRPRKSSDT